jgi:hypothetical protein
MNHPEINRTKNKHTGSIIAIVITLVIGALLLNNPPKSVVAATNESSSLVSEKVKSNSDNYVTHDKYDQIQTGMSYDQVKEIIGSEGQNIFESGDKSTNGYQISYMWLGKNWGEATISFTGKDKLVVQLKSQSRLK